ncbi:MAG: nucleotide exchange factor GrpE [Pseudomonadota bacterium]
MAMTSKPRKEPEVTMPGGAAAPGPEDLTVEDLVPGLEDAIAEQDDAAPDADPVATMIAALEDERDAYKDKWARALAEAENVRRRAQRDKQDAETYGSTKFARDVLTVYDNLERAMQVVDDSLREQAASFIEGIDLTQRELLKAFEKHKIERVIPEKGERFDPNRHQAMFEAPVPSAEAGTIIEVMQDGFVIADRLLRPALVGVAKAAVEPAPAKPAAEIAAESARFEDARSEDARSEEIPSAEEPAAPPDAGADEARS